MSDIIASDIQSLLDSWIEMEKNGNKFPVPFDLAYSMAGYSHKRTAKAKLPKPMLGKLYAVSPQKSTGGRPKENIRLSIEGLKHLCLMADTPEGYAIREYFIDCQEKWALAQKVAPQTAGEVEKIHLEIKLAETQRDAALAQQKLMATAQCLETISPGLAPLVLGHPDAVVTRVEVVEHHAAVNERGQTVAESEGKSKTAIAKSLGMKRAKDLTKWLESIDRLDLLDTGMRVIACEYIPTDSISEIHRLWRQQQGDRQKVIGE